MPLSRQQRVDALSRSVLLGVLPPVDLERLAEQAIHKKVGPGETLFRRGDPGASLFVLLEGRVKITALGPSGAEVILNVIEPDEVFGEMSLIDGAPRCADAVAAAAIEIITVRRSDFLAVLDAKPSAAREVMALLCDRIRQTTEFVESAVLMPAPARLFLRLKGLAEQFGVRRRNGSIEIRHGFSQQELGDIAGLTRVSVNKFLSNWRREGLLNYERGVIVVANFEALSERALSSC